MIWLLDQCPADYRSYPALRRHPAALAWLAQLHLESQLEAMRSAYRTVRVDLAEAVPAGSVPELLVCLEQEGLRLRAAARSVTLLREALAGGVFIPRL